MISLVADAMWVAALVPLAVALVCRRSSPAGSMLIALAFAVAFAGDGIARLMSGAWEAAYLWLPVQLGIVLIALCSTDRAALWWGLALGLAMAFDVLVQGTGPDMLITVVGSCAIVLLAINRRHPLRLPLALYFGVGSALYLAMVQRITVSDFLWWWGAYQGARVVAWVAFAVILYQAHKAHVKPVPGHSPRRVAMKLYPIELPQGVG